MRLFRWGYDVHDTGYKIFTLFYSKKFLTDIYIFRYPEGSYIPKHKDPGKGGKMYRLTIELKKPKKGGQFVCKKCIWSWRNRIFIFRADNSYHYVTPIEEGSRWVLSMGKIFKASKKK